MARRSARAGAPAADRQCDDADALLLTHGRLEFAHKGPVESAPEGFLPWFALPGRRSLTHTILCGHWSALGYRRAPGLVALDSGCLWGGALTAMRLEDGAVTQLPCDARGRGRAGGDSGRPCAGWLGNLHKAPFRRSWVLDSGLCQRQERCARCYATWAIAGASPTRACGQALATIASRARCATILRSGVCTVSMAAASCRRTVSEPAAAIDIMLSPRLTSPS